MKNASILNLISDLKIEIYLDTANLDVIESLAQEKYIKGFTSNPSLMAKYGIDSYENFINKFLKISQSKPVSFEVCSDELNEMYEQAKRINSYGNNIFVKIPYYNTKGIETIKIINDLTKQNIKVNVTAIMTFDQIKKLVDTKEDNTETILSIFAGRIADSGQNASETIKRVCLELGGKGGNIVFSDSHPDAVREGVRNIMSNSGQSCDAPTRMLVEKSIYKRAIEEAADEANKIKVDIALKKGDHIGPVISQTQYDKIIDLIRSGIKEGATLLAGGAERPEGLNKGYFLKPTIFTDVSNDMRIAKEEIFGPVLSIIPFETEDEAISIVNETSYGLGNYVQTQNKVKAKRVAKKFRSGGVYINGHSADPGTPFGGYRQSGNGREGGNWGLEEYLEVKTICGWD